MDEQELANLAEDDEEEEVRPPLESDWAKRLLAGERMWLYRNTVDALPAVFSVIFFVVFIGVALSMLSDITATISSLLTEEPALTKLWQLVAKSPQSYLLVGAPIALIIIWRLMRSVVMPLLRLVRIVTAAVQLGSGKLSCWNWSGRPTELDFTNIIGATLREVSAGSSLQLCQTAPWGQGSTKWRTLYSGANRTVERALLAVLCDRCGLTEDGPLEAFPKVTVWRKPGREGELPKLPRWMFG